MAPKAEAGDLDDRLQPLRQELRDPYVRLKLWTLEDTATSSPELLPLPATRLPMVREEHSTLIIEGEPIVRERRAS